jgi:hypothetical protein
MATYFEIAHTSIQIGFVAIVDSDETVDIMAGALAQAVEEKI